jgi:hypothetical protein
MPVTVTISDEDVEWIGKLAAISVPAQRLYNSIRGAVAPARNCGCGDATIDSAHIIVSVGSSWHRFDGKPCIVSSNDKPACSCGSSDGYHSDKCPLWPTDASHRPTDSGS